VGGSYRTLSPAMREWRAARRTASEGPAEPVPEAVAERAVRPVSRTREGNMKIEKTKPKKSISEVVRLAGCLIAVV